MKKLIVLMLFLSGCGNIQVIDESHQQKFEYDYIVENKSKKDLFHAAEYYFAKAFVNANVTYRIKDIDRGFILGRGATPWTLLLNDCLAYFDFEFTSEDNKANLILSIERGIPVGSGCQWDLPTVDGYAEIKSDLESFAKGLEIKLKGN